MTTQSSSVSLAVEREAEYGRLPVLSQERRFGFWDALVILGGYGIATWCYTQGAFQANYVNFWQLLATVIGGNVLILAIYMLPIVFATRYGIDLWQWLKAIFGSRGIKILVPAIILVNFPWFGVNAEIFASTLQNLFEWAGVSVSPWVARLIALSCIVIGTLLALGGPIAIKWTNRLLVPALIIVGILTLAVAFTAVPARDLLAYTPDLSSFTDHLEPYMLSVEASFAFGFSWCCSTAVIPRLVRKERQGYWATVGAYGVIAPFFVVGGGALAMAYFVTYGTLEQDFSRSLSQLAPPVVMLFALLFIAFANLGTHATGTYLWSVVVKSAFPNAKYSVIVLVLAAYASVIIFWGGILDYFGAMISIAAFLYGPIMGLIFVDYFLVRNRKLDLRSTYDLPGSQSYRYTGGINWIGFVTLVLGLLSSVAVFDAVNYTARLPLFEYTTSSLLGFLVSGLLYGAAFLWIPGARRYMLRDRQNITI